jgi:hypothetical protein
MPKLIRPGSIKDQDPDQVSDEISGRAIKQVLKRRKEAGLSI